ncbi:MAG: hypothetical protein Kow0080_31890 [Candidatus Promineifilaceae bacterium]
MKFWKRLKKIHRPIALGLALVMLVIAGYGALQVSADTVGTRPSTGMICTENATATFTLTAKEGYINLTDGNVVYMWSYADGQDDFQHPGPILCVNQGDLVTVVLHNELPDATSIMFPGQSNVMANGEPVMPQYDANGQITSLVQTAVPGGSVTYTFVADEPGTYAYESGTNPGIQVQMGLFGALIVRPTMGPNYAYNNADTIFNPDTEYILMLSEIDPILHTAIERGDPFDMKDYKARYFLINGRTFPDTIAPNNASWLPNQPYGALAHISPHDPNPFLADGTTPNPAYNPDPALARYLGFGLKDYPFHPHAFNSRVIARDGRLLKGPLGEDIAYERFSLPIGPSQTTDAIFSWTDVEGWDPNDPTKPLPVNIPGDQNLSFGLFYGSPFLGNNDQLPVGTASFNQCGEFYHIAHNHALQQITGWGVVLVGQVTFTRIDPPLPNNCP